jgi:uncharacterized protein YbjT (DUF2867 family)
MKILIFGATGMVGQGVLRECLNAADVEAVLAVGRTSTGLSHAKLQEIVVPDLFDVTGYSGRISGSHPAWDACFFCLGVSSGGMTEADYTHMTYNLVLAVAEELAKLNPAMTFVYVSGQGTDSSEHGRAMWARVKGRLENALLRLPFRAAYMFRPGFILPLNGIQSKTKSYRILYGLLKPVSPLLHRAFPNQVLTTAEVGQAMLAVARHGPAKRILEVRDLRALLSRG